MERSRPQYLIDQLLRNELLKEELDELLAGLGENEMYIEYSTILKTYFYQLIIEHQEQAMTQIKN